MSNYNIQMHNYNGVGYDNLYPKTKSNMVLDGDTNLETKLKYYSNENLLDNWYFVGGGNQHGEEKFPINQRGQTTYNNQWSYSIDRWLIPASNVPVTVNSGSVSFNTIDQLTDTILPSGTYTASVLLADGKFFSGTAHYTQGTYVEFISTSFDGKDFYIFLMEDDASINGHPRIRVQTYPGDIALSVVALKFELGDTQTLAHQDANGNWVLNEIPNYQEQLFRCQTSRADTSDTYSNMANTVGPKFVCNPNLLDNWYFIGGGSQQGGGQFPINQRDGYVVPPGTSYWVPNVPGVVGVTDDYYTVIRKMSLTDYIFVKDGIEYACGASNCVPGYSGSGYGIDRWYAGYGEDIQVTINDGYVTFACTEVVNRMPPNQVPLDSYVTVSALYADGHMDIATGKTPQTVPSGYLNVCSNGNVYFGYYDSLARVGFQGISSSNPIDVVAVKLELGDIQTLAHQENGVWVLNEIPNFQQELAKCQRYYYVIRNDQVTVSTNSLLYANALNTKYFSFVVTVPSQMRVRPTVMLSGVNLKTLDGVLQETYDSTTATARQYGNLVRVEKNIISEALTLESSRLYRIDLPSIGGEIIFDANL